MFHDKARSARDRVVAFVEAKTRDPDERLALLHEFEAFCVEGQVAQMLKDLRAACGLSQEQFAARLGRTQAFVSRLEKSSNQSLATLNLIAATFGYSVKITLVPQVATAPEPSTGALNSPISSDSATKNR